MNRKSVVLLSLIILLFLVKYFYLVSAADFSQGISIDVEIAEKSVPEGSIISLTEGKYRLSTIPYDGSVFGIVTNNPGVAFRDKTIRNKYAVVTF